MTFVPAGEMIGKAHRVRTVELRDSPHLPDGKYQFVDMYCTDPSCDCRKTMIHVLFNDVHVSTINFGWESVSFYQKWMGRPDDDIARSMSGASIDITSPDRVSPDVMLAFFNALLNPEWIGKFKAHYAAVKRKLEKAGQTKDKRDFSRHLDDRDPMMRRLK